MLVSRNWLQEYVDVSKFSDIEIADALTFAGIEVESFYNLVNCKDIVVGEIVEIKVHPNADKLSICMVDVGEDILRQIVCGASNVQLRTKVVVALPGSKLGDVTIKKTNIRNVESYGMLCALNELGVDSSVVEDKYSDGIYHLPYSLEVGSNAIEQMYLNDTVFELSLTPNRADCLNILGVAYELSATLNIPINKRTIEYVAVKSETKLLDLIVSSDDVNYFSLVPIHNLNIKESSLKVKAKLMASGIKPVNNVVDITNFVMIELGQPTHAFDLDKASVNVEVRNAFSSEKLTLLNGEEKDLCKSDIVVANQDEVLSLAGIMGGSKSKVNQFTSSILLEVAQFDNQVIRLSSKNHNLRSESSMRFEKGIDTQRSELAMKMCISMLVSEADAKLSTEPIIYKRENSEFESFEITVSTEKINQYVGHEIEVDKLLEILDRLKFSYKFKDNVFYIKNLSRRPDIEYDVCIIEEIIRVYGLNNIKSRPLKTVSTTPDIKLYNNHYLRVINKLINMGYFNVSTYSLTNESKAFLLDNENLVKIVNPISSEREYLRTTLLYSLLDVCKYNLDRQISDIKVFELSQVSFKGEEGFKYKKVLSGMVSGALYDLPIHNINVNTDFYFVKGTVEKLLHTINFFEGKDYSLVIPSEIPEIFHPYQVAEIVIDNKSLGFIGKIHPKFVKDDVYAFEIDFAAIDEELNEKAKISKVTNFPVVKRDLSVVLDKDINVIELLSTIRELNLEHLKSEVIYNEYVSESLGDKKSVTVKLVFGSDDRTLTDIDVSNMIDEIVSTIENKLDAKLR